MAPKLLIIQPSYYRNETGREVVKVQHRQLVPLTLAYLAALVPPDWDVQLVDEMLEPVDFTQPVDLVALTMLTAHSLRGYDLAAEFRRRGIPVVIGGPHAFFIPKKQRSTAMRSPLAKAKHSGHRSSPTPRAASCSASIARRHWRAWRDCHCRATI